VSVIGAPEVLRKVNVRCRVRRRMSSCFPLTILYTLVRSVGGDAATNSRPDVKSSCDRVIPSGDRSSTTFVAPSAVSRSIRYSGASPSRSRVNRSVRSRFSTVSAVSREPPCAASVRLRHSSRARRRERKRFTRATDVAG
jgi:hypothetical protein